MNIKKLKIIIIINTTKGLLDIVEFIFNSGIRAKNVGIE